MPEADPDHLAAVRRADEFRQSRDPRQRFVNAGRRSGNQISGVGRGIGWQLARRDVEILDGEVRPEQLREHRSISAELALQGTRRTAGFENAEFHARLPSPAPGASHPRLPSPDCLAAALPPSSTTRGRVMATESPLAGRHALITGGGTGIGAAAALSLYAEGAALSLLGRRLEPLQAIADSLRGTAVQ